MTNRALLTLCTAFLTSLLTALPPRTMAQLQCEGDIDGDGEVSVAELVTAVTNSLHGCSLVGPRFVDNADGTISDNLTGLMWEKKVDGQDCLHCWIDRYTWDFAMSEWLSQVNGSSEMPGLGGFSDWRLPSVGEQQTIVDCSFGIPCLDPVFGPSATSCYWTSVTGPLPEEAFTIDFSDGSPLSLQKYVVAYARAVRGSQRSSE